MKRLLLFALLVALLAAGCGGGGTASLGSDDVAVVGGQEVTREQFDSLLARAQKSYAAQKRPFPKAGSRAYETLKGQAVEFLLQRAEFEERAGDLGVKVTNKQIDARIEKLKKQFYGGSEKRYEDTLKAQGLTPDQARDEVRAQLISEGLFKKVTEDIKVSDKQIEDYYAANKSVYVQRESRDVRHILVTKKPLADQLYAKLKSGANFAKLAKKYSKDPGSAQNGGRLTVTRGQTVPPFDKTAFSLANKAISQPVKTQYGYHIIQALSPIRPAKTTPLDKVLRNSIRQQLEQQRKNDKMTKWVDDAKKDYCKGDKIKYQTGFTPNPDPCLAVTSSTSTAATDK